MANDKERVALGSIAASAGLTLAKTVVGLLSGSLAILSEAAHSLLDLAATVITYFAVRISGKPADREHQYGHGKVASFAVIAISIVVDFFRARVLSRTAAKTSSQALEADALHFSSDMWSSLAVLVGLFAVALGFRQADSIAAIVVAMFVCLAGWRLGKRTIDTLTDTAPSGVAERVAAIARKIRGIVAVEQVRARPGGATLFVELAVAVSRALPLDRVAKLKDEVTRAIHEEMPRAELTVTTHPRALDDETVLDRVMVIARNRGLAVHHVMVHEVSGKLLVALDLEVDGQLSLGAAHDIASALEAAIAEELGTEVERGLKARWPSIKRVIGHAEPRR